MFAFSSMALLVGGLLTLFHFERVQGVRHAPRVRAVLDAGAMRIARAHVQASALFGSDTVRQTMHYGVHMLLTAMRSSINWISGHFDALIRINRRVAHRGAGEAHAVSHLQEMMKHKAATALTEEEKKKRKTHAIGMR